jgi:surfeit locus 1 family protein
MVICVVAFSWLAVWQYHRAHEREARIAAVKSARNAAPASLSAGNASRLARYAHVSAQGRYAANKQVLLMEMTQPRGVDTGYEILTPLVLTSGHILLVNRGWVPMDEKRAPRADLAPPEGTVNVVGYLAPLPRPGLHLGGNPRTVKHWPAQLLFPGWPELDRLYGPHLMHRMMLLGSDAPGGYARHWEMRPRHGPHQNYSYMVQWIAFAVIVFGLWLWFTVKRLRRREEA